MDIFVQSADFDCAVACIEMLAAHHGQCIDARGFRGQVATQDHDSPVARFAAMARIAGLEPTRVCPLDLHALKTPCILPWDQHHFVVLTQVNGERATILDPARGRLDLDMQELRAHLTGDAIELTPTSGFGETTVMERTATGTPAYCSTCGWVEAHGYMKTKPGALESSDVAIVGFPRKSARPQGRLSTERLGKAPVIPASNDTAKAARLEVSGLGFRYTEESPWVLKDCSFTLEEGGMIAILGAAHCGKTTLAKLLLGLLPPVEGVVRLDGWELGRFNPVQYRRLVAAVTQHDELVAGTIVDHIAGGSGPIDGERVTQVARMAGVHEDVLSLPQGYDTPSRDLRSAFSGTQRQRLSLAKALYGHPRMLLVDGVAGVWNDTCMQDSDNDVCVIHLARSPTTPDADIIDHAERVLLLEGGKISERPWRRDVAMPADTKAQGADAQ